MELLFSWNYYARLFIEMKYLDCYSQCYDGWQCKWECECECCSLRLGFWWGKLGVDISNLWVEQLGREVVNFLMIELH